jgi:hypothetical protein
MRSQIIPTPFFCMKVFLISSEILHILTIDIIESEVKRAPFSLGLEMIEVNTSTRLVNSPTFSSKSLDVFF